MKEIPVLLLIKLLLAGSNTLAIKVVYLYLPKQVQSHCSKDEWEPSQSCPVGMETDLSDTQMNGNLLNLIL